LCLYVIENNTIRRVLNNLETDGYWGEWDTTCYGEFTDSKCILIINDHQTNGYNDLLIKCTNTETKAYPADEQKYDKDPFNIECLESKKTSTFKGIVTYSNGIYQLKH